MAIDALLSRARPIEWWGVRPAKRWMFVATVAALAYTALPYVVEDLGIDLFGLELLAVAVWLALAIPYVILWDRPALYARRLHSVACALFAGPALLVGAGLVGLIIFLFVLMAVTVRGGGRRYEFS